MQPILEMEMRSKITQLAEGGGNADGVEHGRQIDQLLCDGAADGREDAVCPQYHTRKTQNHAADSALESDAPHPSPDMHQLVDFLKRALQYHGVRRFRSNVAFLSECDADCRCLHSRRIVDAVADKHGLA